MKLHLSKRVSRVRYSGVVLVDFEVCSLPLDELWCPVSTVPAFVTELSASVSAHGLYNPIVVVRGPREDIIRDYGIRPRGLPESPVVNVVWGGTNRIAAIRSLGYSHADCVLVPNFALASQVQEAQRKNYSKRKKNGTA